MPLRLRTSDRSRNRSSANPEDRFQFWVTIGFVALIIAVVLILVASVALQYYNAHLKPVASVEGTTITRDDASNRLKLTLFRISRAEDQVRQSLAAGLLDEQTASSRLQSLQQAAGSAPTQSIEDLIDLIFQGKLAEAEGITVTDADVQAAMDREGQTPERRRAEVVFVEPETDEIGSQPTDDADGAARDKAEAAAAELADGVPFAQVAAGYSTDVSRENGGAYGIITKENPTDPGWVDAMFGLEVGGTTDVIKGADGVYRIGRVVEILPAEDDPLFEEQLTSSVGLDVYRADLRREEVARLLRERITDQAITGEQDQVRLAEILIEQNENEDEASGEGVIHASHILYSPNSDPAAASTLPPEDPAWKVAEEEAKAEVARLQAISDEEARTTAFEESAMAESDDTQSGAQGGDLGFFSRAAPYVPELADPLFDATDLGPGDVVGPYKSGFGYHVVLFLERRAPTEERIQEVTDRLAEPDADFAAIARELSDGDEAAAGGEIGWRVKQQLPAEAVDRIFALQPGEVSEGLNLEDGFHVYKVLERETRPLEPDQVSSLRATAFDAWYEPKKTQAEDEGRITRDPELAAGSEGQPGDGLDQQFDPGQLDPGDATQP